MKDIKAYYPATDEYFQYYDANSALSVALALAQLEKYIEIEGPFDGVLGFSQGASLAAAYLVHLSRDFPSRPLPFRCAVFFCGGPPFDPQAVEQNELRLMDAEETGPILELPTAHMWARNDKVWPGGGEMLSELCEETERNIYVHNEGHSIPGPRAKEALQGCVRAIRRTIARTEMMQ
ncbi:MAG: hypothetical protein LQ337_006759 [Flavoplaca oasis]|nr:MAG: hypothetical protein LQ337_006759 [Flavoplaca oasis]